MVLYVADSGNNHNYYLHKVGKIYNDLNNSKLNSKNRVFIYEDYKIYNQSNNFQAYFKNKIKLKHIFILISRLVLFGLMLISQKTTFPTKSNPLNISSPISEIVNNNDSLIQEAIKKNKPLVIQHVLNFMLTTKRYPSANEIKAIVNNILIDFFCYKHLYINQKVIDEASISLEQVAIDVINTIKKSSEV